MGKKGFAPFFFCSKKICEMSAVSSVDRPGERVPNCECQQAADNLYGNNTHGGAVLPHRPKLHKYEIDEGEIVHGLVTLLVLAVLKQPQVGENVNYKVSQGAGIPDIHLAGSH